MKHSLRDVSANGSAARDAVVARAVGALSSGRPVAIVDQGVAPVHGALALSPGAMSDANMRLFLDHTAGIIRVAATEAYLRAHAIKGPEASISLRDGPVAVSPEGRAATIRALAASALGTERFVRPGYVLLARVLDHGVLQRPAIAEAAVDLMRLADLPAAAAISEVTLSPGGGLAPLPALERLTQELGIPVLTVADLVAHRLERDSLVERVTEASLPTRSGDFRCVVYRSLVGASEHLALVAGEIGGDEPVLARVQRSFPLEELQLVGAGPVSPLEQTMTLLSAAGRGVLVYLRPYPSIGAGLVHELEDRAARLEAQPSQPFLGFDEHQHGIGAQILRDLGVRRLRLLTDHPGRHRGLDGFGLEVVEYVPLTRGDAEHRKVGSG